MEGSLRRVIIDANVWVKYARTKDLAPLFDRFDPYGLSPIVNNYLLSEIFEAVVDNGWMNETAAQKLIALIRRLTVLTTEDAVYRLSPDPKDNYLFDLAVQNNCVFIISDDGELLRFAMKPVPVQSSGWFLKNFPIVEE